MTVETLLWLKAGHIFAFLTWVGSLIGLSFMLKQHAKAAEAAHPDFIALEKGTAMAMDIGAVVALILGSILLIEIKPSLLKGQGGFMHAKLTLVTVLLGLHGFQRMRVGKYKRGKVTPEPGWIIPAIEVSIVAIIVFIVVRPF